MSGALLATTACGSGDDTTGTPASAAASAKSDHSVNTAMVCDSTSKIVNTESAKATVKAAVEAAVKGKKTQAEINAAALGAVKKVMIDWVTPLEAEAAKAEDPALKQALLDFAAEFKKAITELKSLDLDIDAELGKSTALKASSDKLSALCPTLNATPTPSASS
jgi:hypothetical protein